MRATGAYLLVAVLALTGCGTGHDIDRDAWAEDLAEHGKTVEDWQQFEDVWTGVCDRDVDELAVFVAVGLDEGVERDYIRTNVENACPDRLGDLEQAFDNVQG